MLIRPLEKKIKPLIKIYNKRKEELTDVLLNYKKRINIPLVY